MLNWFRKLLQCKHHDFAYQEDGGKPCPYNQCKDPECCHGDCSVPAYHILCLDCGKDWLIGEDDAVDHFASRIPNDIPLEIHAIRAAIKQRGK